MKPIDVGLEQSAMYGLPAISAVPFHADHPLSCSRLHNFAWATLRILRFAVGMAMICGMAALTVSGSASPHYERISPPSLKSTEPIPRPGKSVVLTVVGATAGNTASGNIEFDIATLERIGLVRFTSKNRWYNEPMTYEGVLGSAFLDAVGVPDRATTIRATALNDYVVRIPIEDLRRWPVVLALKLNGKYMSIRDKGPIWIVYPNHVFEELGGPAHQGKWIWQLKEIAFE